MKTNKTFAFILFLTLSSFITHAQDAKTIMKNHMEAVGGLKKWDKVKSLMLEGEMEVMGLGMPVKMSYIRDKGMRHDFSVMGSESFIIITPTKGWTYIPAQGDTEAEEMTADDLKGLAEDMPFEGKLMTAYRTKATVTLEGKETVNGTAHYKLKVVNTDQSSYTAYVDAATWYLTKTVSIANARGQGMEVAITYSSYTKLPEGIVIAMKVDGEEAGVTTFSKAIINTLKDDSILKP